MICKLLLSITFLSCMTSPAYGDEETEKIFTNLYATGAWGLNDEGLASSGPNTSIRDSLSYIQFLEDLLKTYSIQSVVDVGCGDWAFSKAIDWKNVQYTGIDIVKPVIEKNQSAYSSSHISFIHGDMNEMELPAADLLICKDVLQYLPKNKILSFLAKLRTYKYCLFINDVDPYGRNKSIVCGDHRPLDLTKAPFSLSGVQLFNLIVGSATKQVILTTSDPLTSPNSSARCFNVNKVHPYQGFFSVFLTVVNYLDLYDKNEIDGLKIDFKNHGLFYDTAYGPNSWGYYFQPVELGVCSGSNVVHEYSEAVETGRISYLCEIGLSRERIAQLIQKYVQIKPDILTEVETFVQDQFQDTFVIGIHYRGTDKSCEAQRVGYEDITKACLDFIKEKKLSDFTIFVATDEEAFVTHMQKTYPGKVISQQCLRSSDTNSPIHYFNPKNDSHYRLGKEALIDCLLLSKCNQLIKTSSCLSLVSTFFNPELPVITLNERTRHCYNRF